MKIFFITWFTLVQLLAQVTDSGQIAPNRDNNDVSQYTDVSLSTTVCVDIIAWTNNLSTQTQFSTDHSANFHEILLFGQSIRAPLDPAINIEVICVEIFSSFSWS